MATLPLDILRLLPPHLDLPSLLELPKVCKLWRSTFSLPSKVSVFLEFWDEYYPIDSGRIGTLALGQYGAISPSILRYRNVDKYWEDCYYSWWVEVPLSSFLAAYNQKVKWSLMLNPLLVPGTAKTLNITEVGYDCLYLVQTEMEANVHPVKFQCHIGPFPITPSHHPVLSKEEVERAFFENDILEVRDIRKGEGSFCLIISKDLGFIGLACYHSIWLCGGTRYYGKEWSNYYWRGKEVYGPVIYVALRLSYDWEELIEELEDCDDLTQCKEYQQLEKIATYVKQTRLL